MFNSAKKSRCLPKSPQNTRMFDYFIVCDYASDERNFYRSGTGISHSKLIGTDRMNRIFTFDPWKKEIKIQNISSFQLNPLLEMS